MSRNRKKDGPKAVLSLIYRLLIPSRVSQSQYDSLPLAQDLEHVQVFRPVRNPALVASWQAGKSVPTASDIATIAARYGVSEAYLRGEVDFPESNLSALQRRLMDSTHDLTDDEMRKVIEYVRFVKFLRE